MSAIGPRARLRPDLDYCPIRRTTTLINWRSNNFSPGNLDRARGVEPPRQRGVRNYAYGTNDECQRDRTALRGFAGKKKRDEVFNQMYWSRRASE